VVSARLAVELLEVEQDGTGDGAARYPEWRDLVIESLAPLRLLIGDEPHQLVARGYAELAGLAHRAVSAETRARSRARNEREAERSMPPFDVDLYALTHDLAQHRMATDATAKNIVEVFPRESLPEPVATAA
jgi:hypothetical protein